MRCHCDAKRSPFRFDASLKAIRNFEHRTSEDPIKSHYNQAEPTRNSGVRYVDESLIWLLVIVYPTKDRFLQTEHLQQIQGKLKMTVFANNYFNGNLFSQSEDKILKIPGV